MKDDKVEKLIRNGQVAVLYAPGFGAGWSTWCAGEQSANLIFDPQIADLVDRGGDDWREKVESIVKIKYPEAYTGGIEDLHVAWLPVGTEFRIVEFDGNEMIEIRDKIKWICA